MKNVGKIRFWLVKMVIINKKVVTVVLVKDTVLTVVSNGCFHSNIRKSSLTELILIRTASVPTGLHRGACPTGKEPGL
jgi:hypothetical protein